MNGKPRHCADCIVPMQIIPSEHTRGGSSNLWQCPECGYRFVCPVRSDEERWQRIADRNKSTVSEEVRL